MMYVLSVARSDTAKVSIDQLSYGEVLGADEALQLNLLRVLVEVNEDFVFVVEPIVQKHSLDVVLLSQEIMQFGKPVLFAH